MTREERWNKLVAAIEQDIPGFRVAFKTKSTFQKLLGYLSVWSWKRNDETGEREYGYMSTTTTLGSTVWFSSKDYVNQHFPSKTLEHEWVHLKDARSFFGLLPFFPPLINRILFSLTYIAVLPWPGCFRAYAELRAYRRSLELTEDPHRKTALGFYIREFTGPSYFFMWPFPRQVERLLQKPSPYKNLMDNAGH